MTTKKMAGDHNRPPNLKLKRKLMMKKKMKMLMMLKVNSIKNVNEDDCEEWRLRSITIFLKIMKIGDYENYNDYEEWQCL